MARIPKETDSAQKAVEERYTNTLINESSPYLLQHAHNPVNWYPWGEEALEKAKRENKPLIISIGYAACHWCHVMEHESFEHEDVAKLMNDNFVSIKIDREEHPDIDQIYMDAAHLITGRGGWPLNAFALPDGRPFYAGTYFPKKDWLQLLERVHDLYVSDNENLTLQAEKITKRIQDIGSVKLFEGDIKHTQSDLDHIVELWLPGLDQTNGGSARAPKFPMPAGWKFFLHYDFISRDKRVSDAVELTLKKMAYGGIYDHVGGGFARYSVDEFWHIPHFEKMLYDNGQLISLYSLAYQRTKDPLYKKVVYESIEFAKRELMSEEFGFYSSLDADSEGVEGKFYVWEKSEIDALLGGDSDMFCKYYHVNEGGNWEHGKNNLMRTVPDEEFSESNDIELSKLNSLLQASKKILLDARAQRVRPALDDKILTSWNALMLNGLITAYRVFDDDQFLDLAQKNASFIFGNLMSEDFRLDRNYKNGKSSINGFLDDYVFLVDACINLYQSTFEEEWLAKAKSLTDYAIEHFSDKKSGMFFYTSDLDKALISKKLEISDNVIPASNSQMAINLFVLGQLMHDDNYVDMSEQMLKNIKSSVANNGAYFANWAFLMTYFTSPPYTVAILGKDAVKVRKKMDAQFLGNAIFSGGETEGSLKPLKNKAVKGQTTIYVCQNRTCKMPTTEVEVALKEMSRK